MERLKNIKENLIACVQSQMSNLSNVNTEELGEAIDMIKDLEEAIYYHTITEAMKEKEKSSEKEYHHYYTEPYYPSRDIDRDMGRMYYSSNSDSGDSSQGHRNGNSTENMRYYSENYMKDPKEGRSPYSRKMYMESKSMHKDKASQLKELEKYMQELTQDIIEMIEDASPEERQYLEKKISTLASKVGQMN